MVDFDLIRRRAEFKVQMGGPFPEAFVSAMRTQNAVLLRIQDANGLPSGRKTNEECVRPV